MSIRGRSSTGRLVPLAGILNHACVGYIRSRTMVILLLLLLLLPSLLLLLGTCYITLMEHGERPCLSQTIEALLS